MRVGLIRAIRSFDFILSFGWFESKEPKRKTDVVVSPLSILFNLEIYQ